MTEKLEKKVQLKSHQLTVDSWNNPLRSQVRERVANEIT